MKVMKIYAKPKDHRFTESNLAYACKRLLPKELVDQADQSNTLKKATTRRIRQSLNTVSSDHVLKA